MGLVESDHTQQVGAAIGAQLAHAAVGGQRGLRIPSRQFNLTQQSPVRHPVFPLLDQHAGDSIGGLHIAPGQVNASQEYLGSERCTALQALLHHCQRIVGPVLGQEGFRPPVERRYTGGSAGGERIQTGVGLLNALPAQKEVEQAAAVAA